MNDFAREDVVSHNNTKCLTRCSVEPEERREALMRVLPESYEPYTDKYFLRSLMILERSGINPWVRAQVMIRQGPGEVRGINEAVAVIEKYSKIQEHGGRVYALEEGDHYDSLETLLIIEAPIQDIISLETMYLGVLSGETTKANDGIEKVDLDAVRETMHDVVEASQGRPVMYFGPRHWRYDEDAAISLAAHEGGATSSSSDVGAAMFGTEGVGTIPHVLENIFAWVSGKDTAVLEATRAFDRCIDPKVARIALIDYNNREIHDALTCAYALGNHLYGVRVDTCGENIAQGALASLDDPRAEQWRKDGVPLIPADHPHAKYWYGHGVTVTGVYALRKVLDDADFVHVKIVLSSGFADAEKVKAFVEAEKILGVKLFDSLGVGGVFPSRHSKMDIVAVGKTSDSMMPISKVGRGERPNPRLKLVLGKNKTGIFATRLPVRRDPN